LDWNDVFSRILSLRTFSNLWYWLMVCVSWMIASHWILGIPFDMIQRARRKGDQAAADLENLTDINVRRLQALSNEGGFIIVGFIAFLLTSIAMAGFYYRMEVAQGLFFLLFPLTIAGSLSFYTSTNLLRNPSRGAELAKRLMRIRLWIQIIAALSVFFSAAYGMYYNLSNPFGY